MKVPAQWCQMGGFDPMVRSIPLSRTSVILFICMLMATVIVHHNYKYYVSQVLAERERESERERAQTEMKTSNPLYAG